MGTMTSVSPTSGADRIGSIDILRGLALFGVLAVNLLTEFRVSIFQQFLGPTEGSTLDRRLDALVSIIFDMKAFAVFSFLFGVGLAIQYERIARREFPLRLLGRRLLALLVLGLFHLCLIWNGDILTEYAVAGFVVLPFLFAEIRVIGWAVTVCLAIFIVLPGWVHLPPPSWFQAHVPEATEVYAHASYPEYLRYSLSELSGILPLHVLVFPRTVALFLLGMLVWRKNLLRDPGSHRTLLTTVAIAGTTLGFALQVSTPPIPLAGQIFTAIAPVVLALGYSAIAVSIVDLTRYRALLAWAGPLGRMAFTNYVAQSIVFGWIFFGYGMGQFGRMSTTNAAGIGVALYVLQVLYSRWWLRRFRFGPLEWLWRSIMYGRRQPMVGGVIEAQRGAAAPS